uniref:Uncharacterized protein n=1 Tax=Hyaloperonospora arabidopsidis (strain Emoy2) TaxID=559515 RepID=M4BXK8_HYAAE
MAAPLLPAKYPDKLTSSVEGSSALWKMRCFSRNHQHTIAMDQYDQRRDDTCGTALAVI